MGDRIVFVGDAHVKERMYASRPGIKGDAYGALGRLSDRCSSGVSAVVFCGDVFDSRTPSPLDVRKFQEFVRRGRDAGLQVMAIQGNHDLRVGHNWCRDVCGALAVSGGPLGKFPPMLGLDHVPGTSFFEVLSSVPECEILVAHQSWAHLDPFDSAPVGPHDVPDQVSFAMVMGHIHVRDARMAPDGRWMVSPGGLWATGVDKERGGWCELDLSDRRFHFVEDAGARPIHRFQSAAEALAFAEGLPDGDPDLIPIVDAAAAPGEEAAAAGLSGLSSKCHVILRAAAPGSSAPRPPDGVSVQVDRGALVREACGGDPVAEADVGLALEDPSGESLRAMLDSLRAEREEARKAVPV